MQGLCRKTQLRVREIKTPAPVCSARPTRLLLLGVRGDDGLPSGNQAMGKIRYQLRTVMITIAFVALILTVIVQALMLRHIAIRQQVERNIAEHARAEAAIQAQRAEAMAER